MAEAIIGDAEAAISALATRARDGALDQAEALGAIAATRRLATALARAELPFLSAARSTDATWEQIARASGRTGRQGAQKRYRDLTDHARRRQDIPACEHLADPALAAAVPSASRPEATAGARPGEAGEAQDAAVPSSSTAPRQPDEPGPGAEPLPDPDADPVSSQPLRHRRIDGLGDEWSFTVEDNGDAVLWYDRTTRAGGARLEDPWGRKKWAATSPNRTRLPAGVRPSRIRALRLAAERFERQRRENTPAGRDIPLTAAPGWSLRQTLADRDHKNWQVINPDDETAGTVHPSYPGATSWTALSGSPAGYQIPVTPVSSTDDAEMAAPSGEDWKTREAAAYAVVHDILHYENGTEALTPAQAVRKAAALRKARRTRPAPAEAAPPPPGRQPERGGPGREWAESEPLPGAGGWILARTEHDISLGRWRTVAPDGVTAGTVAQTALTTRGTRAWEATSEDPDRDAALRIRISPGPDDTRSAPDGQWEGRDTAAHAIAHYHDPRGTDSPELIALRADADRRRRSAPPVTDAIIRDRQYVLRKTAAHDTTGALDVLVRGRPAGSVRPASSGKGWEPVDLAGSVTAVESTGRTTAAGRAATSDAAAVALLHAVKRYQAVDRRKRAQDSTRTAATQE